MPVSKDLLLSILAMDAYNQGYGRGVEHGETSIGLADFDQDKGDSEAQDAGFYAVAYEVQAGAWEGLAEDTTVISFRGTDRAFGWTGSDAWNGWGIGVGAFEGDQARLGQEFFQAVTGTTDGEARDGNALLTGHSLGGGLAGFLASLHGHEAHIFDWMTFKLASDNAYADADAISGLYARDTFYAGGEPWEIDRSQISGTYVDGEALEGLRQFPQPVQEEVLDPHTELLDCVQLHSMSFLIWLEFAESEKHTDWQTVANQLAGAAFSETIAVSAGFEEAGTNGRYAAEYKQLAAIAYSALDEGNLVFGDTGIRAMFDDLDALGHVYNTSFDGEAIGL